MRLGLLVGSGRELSLNTISFFTGAGGLDLGLEDAGFETRLAVEIDSDCRETLKRNRPSWNPTERFGGDITKFQPSEILRLSSLRRGEVDLIAGGPPCQSFSNIGKRGGFSDQRGQLIRTYIEIVASIRPKLFVFENVQGLLQHPEVLEFMDRELSGRYALSMRMINAADYGVPQFRKRVIVIGALGSRKFQFPEATHSESGFLPNTGHWLTVRDALNAIPKCRLLDPDNFSMNHSEEMKYRISLVKPGRNFHSLPMDLRPRCWKDGRHQGADTFGRLEWDRPSVTIRTCGYNPTKGRYIHPKHNRGLSTVEMAALQTFPSDYSFYGGIGSIGRQIGNAVPPRLGLVIGHALMDFIGIRAAA